MKIGLLMSQISSHKTIIRSNSIKEKKSLISFEGLSEEGRSKVGESTRLAKSIGLAQKSRKGNLPLIEIKLFVTKSAVRKFLSAINLPETRGLKN